MDPVHEYTFEGKRGVANQLDWKLNYNKDKIRKMFWIDPPWMLK